jgi:hypothetical protein
MGTIGKYSGNIQGTIGKYSGHMQGIFRKHAGNMQGTCREHAGNIMEYAHTGQMGTVSNTFKYGLSPESEKKRLPE